MSWPFGVRRSSVMSFLFRLSTANQYEQSPSEGPRRRRSSPRPGISVLITSAPNSAMSVPQNGPATTWASSSTRIPSRGRRVSVMSMSPSGSASSIPWAIVGGSPGHWRRSLHSRYPVGIVSAGAGRGSAMSSSGEQMLEADRYYMRNPDMVAIGTDAHYLFVHADGSLVEIPTPQPARWSHVLQTLMAPTRGATLRRELDGSHAIDPKDLFGLLHQGCLLEASTAAELEMRRASVFTDNRGYHFARRPQACSHLVIGLTGSIVAGLMAPVILSLCYAGFQGRIDVILTEAALHFTTRDLFEGYGIRTWVDPFERRDDVHVPHVALAHSADCVLVMPASAACCHRLAEGACSDLLSLIVAATAAPVVIAPVMNTAMWNCAPVQRNIQRLR